MKRIRGPEDSGLLEFDDFFADVGAKLSITDVNALVASSLNDLHVLATAVNYAYSRDNKNNDNNYVSELQALVPGISPAGAIKLLSMAEYGKKTG